MTRFHSRVFPFLTLLCAAGLAAFPASAQNITQDWSLGLTAPASPSAQHIYDFHQMMLYIITAITLFVLVLLLIVVFRYNRRANPKPAQFSHNVMIEVLWTVVPVLILIVVSLKSLPLLYYIDRAEKPEMSLKIMGRQWYWDYEYPDHGNLAFSSYMIPEKDINKDKGEKRLLSTDTKVVLPVDTTIQLLVRGGDVIHSWAVPALGVKIDAMPGRTNETWVRIERPGTYYGQCSELCGKDHSYMPIEIQAVSKEEFQNWLVKAKEEFAGAVQPLAAHPLKFASKE